MTVERIKSNIWYYNDLIERNRGEISRLEKQIEELDSLKLKYTNLHTRFGEVQQHRQSQLNKVLSSTIENKILRKYYDGMNNLLTGSKFSDASNGLLEAKQIINRKMTDLEGRLDQYEGYLTSNTQMRNYWKGQLNLALSAMEE